VIIAFECTLNAADTLAVVDATGSKLVQVYFDMANALYYGHDPVTEAKALAPRIAEVHIKDGTRQAIVPLGEGHVDVAAVIRTLSQCGYDGYYAFETPLKGDVLQAMARDLAYVKARL
ncbi:MAG: sugar phosphate isomerase/epimerase, partial [Planctomycetes bacterium]|nr:sugar phosphate isomerase/epimerase [Planctomycetota bacterium]